MQLSKGQFLQVNSCRLMPWVESGGDVVIVGDNSDGSINMRELRAKLGKGCTIYKQTLHCYIVSLIRSWYK